MWNSGKLDAKRRYKRPSKLARDRARWDQRCLAQKARVQYRRMQRDLLPLNLAVHILAKVSLDDIGRRWLARGLLALNALCSASACREGLNFTLEQFRQPLLFSRPSCEDDMSVSQSAALESIVAKLATIRLVEPGDQQATPAFVRLGRCELDDAYRRPKESLVPTRNADPDKFDLPDRKGIGCIVSSLGLPQLAIYDDPSFCLRPDADFSVAAKGPGFVGLAKSKLGRLYQRMHQGGLLIAMALSVPLVGGIFGVCKAMGDTSIRMISDLRRAAQLLKAPRKVKLLTPIGLAVFLRSAVRRRRLNGYSGRLKVLTAKRDVSKYYHRLKMSRAWSFLFTLPGVKLGAIRHWLRDLPIWKGGGPEVAPQEFWKSDNVFEEVPVTALSDNTVLYPLPSSLPMGLPDSVLIGQQVHEAIVAPAVNCFFREGEQVSRALGDIEVAGACIVDDLNLFSVCDAERESEATMSVNKAFRKADALSENAGLPSKHSKAEWASSTGRKVAGVTVDGEGMKLQMPYDRWGDLCVITYSICCDTYCNVRMLDKIVSMWTWYGLLRRPSLSVFHASYDWCRRYRDAGIEFAYLTDAVRSELLCITAISPLLCCPLDSDTSLEAFAYDASLHGAGVVSAVLPAADIVNQLEKSEVKGERRLLDPEADSMAAMSEVSSDSGRDGLEDSESLPDPDLQRLVASVDWRTDIMHKWTYDAHINILEAEALLLLVKHICRNAASVGKEFLVLGDSRVVIAASTKGRSSSWRLNAILRKVAAYLLAFDIWLWQRHLPSAWNPSDPPSRGIRTVAGGVREGPLSMCPRKSAVHPILHAPPGLKKRRRRPPPCHRAMPLNSPLKAGSSALRRHLAASSPDFKQLQSRIAALKRKLRKLKVSRLEVQRKGLCVCPALFDYSIRVLGTELKHLLARRTLSEEIWLDRRYTLWEDLGLL